MSGVWHRWRRRSFDRLAPDFSGIGPSERESEEEEEQRRQAEAGKALKEAIALRKKAQRLLNLAEEYRSQRLDFEARDRAAEEVVAATAVRDRERDMRDKAAGG